MSLLAPPAPVAAPVGARPEADTRARVPAPVATVVVVGILVAMNLLQHVAHGPWWIGPTAAVTLVVFARWTGLTWAQLGLHRSQHRAGVRWGVVAVGVVAGVYTIGALLPATRTAFLDVRYHLDVGGALFTAFVAIPVTTILVEEIAFRSVLWGMLARHATTWRVMLGSSALFGLWHILPSVSLASANRGIAEAMGGFGIAGVAAAVLVVAGIVVFTAVGGLVAGELRRRSGSVIASAGMHWATNSLGVLFGLLAWQLAT